MKIIICVSDDLGISFNGRRQSSDKNVIKDAIGMGHVTASEYSKNLLSEFPETVISNDISKADYYFYESGEIDADNIDEVVLYHWNRDYPSDRYLKDVIDLNLFELKNVTEFQGNSHEKITKEIYKRRNA